MFQYTDWEQVQDGFFNQDRQSLYKNYCAIIFIFKVLLNKKNNEKIRAFTFSA